ncbi:MAG: hypothetical protein ACFFDF_01080 [Candidatus Odinarchaeota archaeon]
MPKYNLKIATIKVGHPDGFYRFNQRTGKKDIYVGPFTRKQKVRDYTYSNKLLEHQKAEKDWGHLSMEYPNLLGLTDEEVVEFIKNSNEDKEVVKEYIKHIKCYDKDDIRHYSKKAFKKFEKKMEEKYTYNVPEGKDPYTKDKTIFVTSPRGGFNILGDFGYANKLNKSNLPYDLDRYQFSSETTMKSVSLPYGASIIDVNDIVFVDDIYMSGEQCGKAYNHLSKAINDMKLPKNQKPRLHYLSITGSKHDYSKYQIDQWDSFSVGDELDFRRDGKHFEQVSAVVYPFSIPDGSRHYTARRLYSKKKRFSHRSY